MPSFTLTNRGDDFDSDDVLGWTDASRVFAGNGDDILHAAGDLSVLYGQNGEDDILVHGDRNLLIGGNGKDEVRAIGDGNWLFGGNGSDVLIAVGHANHLLGGNGPDRLVSISLGGLDDVGAGNILTGGNGFDVFSLANRSDLRVVNDEVLGPPLSGGGEVSEGDVIVGVMDVITDYTAGERLRIGSTVEASGPVTLDEFGVFHKHLEIADGEHAFFRGEQLGNGRFAVDDGGGDLLLVYDAAGAGDALSLQGAVILKDFTDPDAVFLV